MTSLAPTIGQREQEQGFLIHDHNIPLILPTGLHSLTNAAYILVMAKTITAIYNVYFFVGTCI